MPSTSAGAAAPARNSSAIASRFVACSSSETSSVKELTIGASSGSEKTTSSTFPGVILQPK
jgi:hypothetical protein